MTGSDIINHSVNVNKNYGMGIQNAFTTPNHNGNLYNQENDKPTGEGEKKRVMTSDAAKEKMMRTRVGAVVNYNLGKGTIVSKRGEYLTISHLDGRHVDTVHVGEVWGDGERIMFDKLWDELAAETRNEVLGKAKLPLLYIDRAWHELPQEARDYFAEVLKEAPGYFEPSGGGHAGREPGITRPDENRSHRDSTGEGRRNDPPQDDKRQAPGLKKIYDMQKSDVEHGKYGGITTDQEPLDATDDYEEDKREGDRKQLRYQDHDAADLKDINPDQAKITIKDGKTPPAAEDDDVDKDHGEGPTFGEGPDNKKKQGQLEEERTIINKYNTRYGPRQASKEEVEKWVADHKDKP